MKNRANKKGQAAVEMTAAIIAASLLFLGTLQIFIWFNRCIVMRQEYYEQSRINAAAVGPGIKGNYDFTEPSLKIFGE